MIKRLTIVLAGIAAFVFVPWGIGRYIDTRTKVHLYPLNDWLNGAGMISIGVLAFVIISPLVDYIKHG